MCESCEYLHTSSYKADCKAQTNRSFEHVIFSLSACASVQVDTIEIDDDDNTFNGEDDGEETGDELDKYECAQDPNSRFVSHFYPRLRVGADLYHVLGRGQKVS